MADSRLAREKERLLKSTERLSRLMVRTELLKGEREEPVRPAKSSSAAGPTQRNVSLRHKFYCRRSTRSERSKRQPWTPH